MKLKRSIKKGEEIFTCSCCGEIYDELPFCFGSEYPDYYFSVPVEERAKRIEMEESLCVVDKAHFFHRGRLEIPIIDYGEKLIFDVWLSISEDNFMKRMDDWDDPDRVNNDPYFGWLQNQIPTYDYSINIKAKAVEEELGFIPKIIVWDEEHDLTLDQKNGISLEKALGIIEYILGKSHLK